MNEWFPNRNDNVKYAVIFMSIVITFQIQLL